MSESPEERLAEILARREGDPTAAAASEDVAPGLRRALGACLGVERQLATLSLLAEGHPERAGPWVLLRPLGQGPAGPVYLGEREEDGVRAAVRFLTALDDDVLRETARRAVGLRHEGLVTVLEATDDWIAADLSSGVSLATVLAALRRDPAPAEVTRTLLGALVPVGRALGEAHARGLVHRGVSTRKIDLGEDGTMRLRDLGHDPTRGGRPPTPDVPPLGSPHHLAPEQCGEAGEIGVAADVYSFATVAWTVAAGHPPHNARSLRGLLRRIASGPPPAGAIEERFGPDLARELTGALATAPGDRPGTLDELLGALTPA